MKTDLNLLIQTLDDLLDTDKIRDYPGAYNGLEIANRGEVRRVAAAVDANLMTIQKAVDAKADLLIVHHGLFWGEPLPLTGINYRKIALCIENNLALYSSHLPLDLHPKLGNNVLLAQALGFKRTAPFFETHGSLIGRMASINLNRNELMQRIERALHGPVRLIAGGPAKIRKLGIVTGGAGGEIVKAAACGIDTFITGEGPHHTFGLAHELGINLIYGGHYATETFGVHALGKWIQKKYKIPFTWIDYPSGL